MDVTEIIKEALYYPINNYKNWAIIAAVFLIIGIIQQISLGQSGEVAGSLGIVSLIIGLIAFGININIMRDTINGSDELPMIKPDRNFIDGIKFLILSVIYVIIPTIITVIVALITGVFTKFDEVVVNASVNGTAVATPMALSTSFFTSLIITFIVAVIVFILFSLLAEIGQARLAQTGSIMQGLDIKEIFNKISSIGWGKYLIYIILTMLCAFIIGLVSSIVSLIPYVGSIIAATIFTSFLNIFVSRATGLIYNEG